MIINSGMGSFFVLMRLTGNQVTKEPIGLLAGQNKINRAADALSVRAKARLVATR
jgi:hypothetical protein